MVKPPDYTTISDEASVDETREAVDEFFAEIVEAARGAVDAEELRGGSSAGYGTCDELYPARFKRLDVGGSFLVPGAEPGDVVDRVVAAFDDRGWQPERTAEDWVSVQTEVGDDGVVVRGSVEIITPSANPDVVAVSVSVRTGCLELPEGAGR
ncbi:hypothetical protein ACHAAC_09625 [Aeromicrobium sp. CF4.19]|uniref:hypothetical protein n=1 Tax=Aeromicrobium sp. CF4.19 TaxID=3373082 RepID=UPI003EE6620F